MKIKLFLVVMTSVFTFASDKAYLDAPYENLVHPIDDAKGFKGIGKSNTIDLINKITSVKAQGSRGTCSIFSATAMLEAMLVIKGHTDNTVDLSEEWLEYLIIAKSNRTSDGSNSWTNFSTIRKYGLPYETTLPYQSEDWESALFNTLYKERCGHLTGSPLKVCQLGHFDPALLRMSNEQLGAVGKDYVDTFIAAYNEGIENRDRMMSFASTRYSVYSTTQIKNLLDAGIPVTVGMDFFYGAWNHRKAVEFGIGRDENNWQLGIVGYPEKGSVDYTKSKENRAGHSVLVVGYDDSKVVTTKVLMKDGTYKEFSYQGVYYFKNSWGTGGFGANFVLDGENHAGYGIITQQYAHEYGSFYQMPLN